MKGYFWRRIWGTPLYPRGILRRTCETVPQPSKLRFGVVREVGRGLAVLDGGPRSAAYATNLTYIHICHRANEITVLMLWLGTFCVHFGVP